MYKVLIADDEPTIREGLRTLIEWELYGYEVVDTAANGQEALRKAAHHSPDLIIADIRMPGMSGLELVEALRKNGSTLHVLILSGYADFDYAKKAISLQIDGYMLKPVDEDELIEYLEVLRTTLEREKQDKQKTAAFSGLSRELIVQSLLAPGDSPVNAYSEEEILAAGLLWDCYEIILIKFQAVEQETEPGASALLKSRLCELYEQSGRGVVFSMEPYVGLLLNGDLHNEDPRHHIHTEIAAVAARQSMEFTAASGGCVRSLTDIGASCGEVMRLMNQRFYYAEDRIAAPGDIPASLPASDGSDNEPMPDYSAVADKIYFAIDVGNRMSVAQLV
ncbi:response regulator, partial [Paenibacillus sepulcri]|nr:response regulator [Paenibacillus sepulcri]